MSGLAVAFVGAVRVLWLPFVSHAIKISYPSSSDTFMLISLSDPTQGMDARGVLKQVVQAVRSLQPVRIHVLRALTCDNETARREFSCCDASAMRRARLRGAKLNYVTKFTDARHAHGLLSYFHVRQAFRDIAAHETQRGYKYEWIIRTRPDLLPLFPMPRKLFDSLPPGKVIMPLKVDSAPADWFFAVHRDRASWFFEEAIMRIFEQALRWQNQSQFEESCLKGAVYHAPEYALSSTLMRSPSFVHGSGKFPVVILRKRQAGGFMRARHVDDAETALGPYELECAQQRAWPRAFTECCLAIDRYLHTTPSRVIENLTSVAQMRRCKIG